MKKRFKISAVDVLIVLFVAAAIVIAANYFTYSTEKAADIPQVSYTVELTGVPNEYRDLVKVGDQIKDSVKGGYLGEITDVTFQDNRTTREDTIHGRFVESSFYNKCDVYMTITGVPTTFGESIKFATQEIKIGKLIYVRNKDYVGSGYIVDVKVEGE